MHPLVRRQLRKAFPGSVPDLPELHAFIASVSNAYTTTDDDRRMVEHSLELASDELVARNQLLEAQVEELRRLEHAVARRTAELDSRNRDMAMILDNVDQGFASVRLDGTLCSECSQTLVRWFGKPTERTPIWSYLAGHDPNLEAWIQLAFDSIAHDVMPLDVVLAQLPARLERDGRQFRVAYQPIGEPLGALLVVVSDLTEELVHRRTERTQRDLIAAIEAAYRDRAGFLAFMRDAGAALQACTSRTLTLDEHKRKLHTLKGSAALFGVMSVAELCHELENQMENTGVAPDRAGWAPLVEAWRAFHELVERLLHVSERVTIEVDRDEYLAVVAAVAASDAPWAVQLRRWGKDSTRHHLERYADQARALAAQLGKAELDVEIADHGVQVDADRFAPIWSALGHVVCNAIDHGIESTEARIAAGKQPRARLRLITRHDGDELVIEIEDNGRGVDWGAVAGRATAMGLPAATAAELADAVFTAGLSTCQELTLTSGRGVGMAAVHAVCTELGARVELASEPGHGTTVRCIVPLASARALPRSARTSRGRRTAPHPRFRRGSRVR